MEGPGGSGLSGAAGISEIWAVGREPGTKLTVLEFGLLNLPGEKAEGDDAPQAGLGISEAFGEFTGNGGIVAVVEGGGAGGLGRPYRA